MSDSAYQDFLTSKRFSFLGIGSEAYVAVKMGRKAIGSELKPSYFKLAARNLKDAEKSQYDLFGCAS